MYQDFNKKLIFLSLLHNKWELFSTNIRKTALIILLRKHRKILEHKG